MAETSHNQPHVLAITFPFTSHPALLLNIIHKLAASDPGTNFSFLGTAKSNATLLGSIDAAAGGFDNIKFYDVEDGVPENHVLSGNPLEEIDLFINAAPDNLHKVIDKEVSDGNKKITCVISDALVWMSGIIAEEFMVPWIPIWTIGSVFLSCCVHADLIWKTINGKINTEPLSFISGMSSIPSSDLPPWIFAYEESGFGRMLHMVGKTILRATAVVTNSFDELESAIIDDLKSKLKIVLPLGPFFAMASPPPASDPCGCMSWLDSHELASVVHVSFDTMITPPAELAAVAEGLEASGLQFVWLLADYAKVHLPVGFAERTRTKGKIVPAAPQTQILQHSAIGVFVTHTAWAAVLEGIVAGVPIIYRPVFGDQMLNGRFVSQEWKIGVNVHDGVFTKDGITKALDLVMHTEQGKQIRKNVQSLKEKAKQAAGPNGSTTNNLKTLSDIVGSHKKNIDMI